MIVWGGELATSAATLTPVADTIPPTDSWTATSTTNAPESTIQYPNAVWTGSEMIVWGGYGNSGNLDTGGRYNPG